MAIMLSTTEREGLRVDPPWTTTFLELTLNNEHEQEPPTEHDPDVSPAHDQVDPVGQDAAMSDEQEPPAAHELTEEELMEIILRLVHAD